MELLFWKTAREAMEITEGYGTQELKYSLISRNSFLISTLQAFVYREPKKKNYLV